jgi:hypothetical protein
VKSCFWAPAVNANCVAGAPALAKFSVTGSELACLIATEPKLTAPLPDCAMPDPEAARSKRTESKTTRNFAREMDIERAS